MVYSINKMVICNTYVLDENVYKYVLPAFRVAFHFSSESGNIFPTPYMHPAWAQLKAFIRGNMVKKNARERNIWFPSFLMLFRDS